MKTGGREGCPCKMPVGAALAAARKLGRIRAAPTPCQSAKRTENRPSGVLNLNLNAISKKECIIMAKMYYAKDCDINYLNGKKIAIIGYGSQGHAHALNLKDSGCDVCVGLRAGSKNWKNAEDAALDCS